MNRIIENANIIQLNDENERARSLFVKDGKIVEICDTTTYPRTNSIPENTKVIDLNGATLLPGFIDTHNHILSYGLMMDMVDCSSPWSKNIEDLLDKIHNKATTLKEEDWIQAYGYDDTVLEEQRHLTREELDRASPDHPVYLSHLSGHIAVANSKAIELAELSEDIEDTSKGQFGRDENTI